MQPRLSIGVVAALQLVACKGKYDDVAKGAVSSATSATAGAGSASIAAAVGAAAGSSVDAPSPTGEGPAPMRQTTFTVPAGVASLHAFDRWTSDLPLADIIDDGHGWLLPTAGTVTVPADVDVVLDTPRDALTPDIVAWANASGIAIVTECNGALPP